MIGFAVNVSSLISLLIKPYMPDVSKEIQSQINLPNESGVLPDNFIPMVPCNHRIGEPKPLFQKLDAKFGVELKKRYAGVKDDSVWCISTGFHRQEISFSYS